jgi:hypothetical protein
VLSLSFAFQISKLNKQASKFIEPISNFIEQTSKLAPQMTVERWFRRTCAYGKNLDASPLFFKKTLDTLV